MTATDNLGATGFAQMWVRVNAGTNDLCITKSGLGTVGRNPSGTPSIPNCWSYVSGTNVVLTATPATGRIFTGWGGACSGTSRTSNCTVNMNGPQKLLLSTLPLIQLIGSFNMKVTAVKTPYF